MDKLPLEIQCVILSNLPWQTLVDMKLTNYHYWLITKKAGEKWDPHTDWTPRKVKMSIDMDSAHSMLYGYDINGVLQVHLAVPYKDVSIQPTGRGSYALSCGGKQLYSKTKTNIGILLDKNNMKRYKSVIDHDINVCAFHIDLWENKLKYKLLPTIRWNATIGVTHVMYYSNTRIDFKTDKVEFGDELTFPVKNRLKIWNLICNGCTVGLIVYNYDK